MRRLTSLVRPGERDRGATTVLVAVLLSGFLLALGAIVTDVGSWYVQRAQVQNGADAGALAVAKTCAGGACDTSAANKYAPANSTGTMDVSSVVTAGFPCGVGPGLPGCPAGYEDGTRCPLPQSNGRPYVDVYVQTSVAMDPILGNVPPLDGKAKTVVACAQASWGAPGGLGNGTALTMSSCEWDKDTAKGQLFGHVPSSNGDGSPNYAYRSGVPTALPSYLDTLTVRRTDVDYIDPATGLNFYVEKTIKDPHSTVRKYSYGGGAPEAARVAGAETVLTTHGFGDNCASGHSGSTAPGQFGWLSNDSCTVVVVDNMYPGSPGNSSAPCSDAFTWSRNTGKPIFLPVFDNVTASGNNTVYSLRGFAAFVVTGWDMTNGSAGNWNVKKAPSLVTMADTSPGGISGKGNYCGKTFTGAPSDVCVYGFFTQALIPPSQLPSQGDPNAPDLGATASYLTG